MSELPEGWALTQLSEVARWSSGGTPSRKNPSYYDGNIPWIKTGDLGVRYLKKVTEHITQDAIKNSSAKLFPANSVAMAMYGATIGRTSILTFEATTNQACAVAIPNNATSTEFIYYLLLNEKENFIAKGKGGAQPNISQAIIKEHEVFIPPLNEQIRIANKLDSMLAKVDAAQARLDKIPNILKRFRQSVLAAATSGELTKEWRDEHKVHLTYKLLGDTGVTIKTGPFGSALHKSDYIHDGISVVNPMHINNGLITPKDSMSITLEKFTELKAWHLEIGDVILGRRGEMGRAAEVIDIKNGMLCGTGSMILRVNSSGLIPSYLCLILRSQNTVNYFESNSVGSTMVNLNQKIIKGLSIHTPSLEEQHEIFRRVESLFSMAAIVEKQYNDVKARTNRLTQSILAKAFRGELVSQDSNDEPASELLARIKTEQVNLKPSKVRKKANSQKTDHV